MLYLLATDAVDGTAFAARVLSIPVREQHARIRLVCTSLDLPVYFRKGDEVRATIKWDALREAGDQEARLLVSVVNRMNREIQPPYDVPKQLTAAEIERWLNDGAP